MHIELGPTTFGIEFLATSCWKCKASMKAVTGIILPPKSCADWTPQFWGAEDWKYYHFWPLNVLPEDTAQRLARKIAALRERAPYVSIVAKKFSFTTKTEYWAAICPECKSLQGAFPIGEERRGVIVSAASQVPMRENRTLIYRPWEDDLTIDLMSTVYDFGESGHPYIDESWEFALSNSSFLIDKFDSKNDHLQLSIGQPVPWDNPANESLAFILMDTLSKEHFPGETTRNSSISNLQPAFLIWLDGDIDREVNCLDSTCIAMGYYRSQEYAHGFPLFIFLRPKDMSQWAIKAPLISSKDNLTQWASNPIDSVLFFLMERTTKRLRVIRQITLPLTLKNQLINSIETNDEPPYFDEFNIFVSKYSEEAIWHASLKWEWNPENDTFEAM